MTTITLKDIRTLHYQSNILIEKRNKRHEKRKKERGGYTTNAKRSMIRCNGVIVYLGLVSPT